MLGTAAIVTAREGQQQRWMEMEGGKNWGGRVEREEKERRKGKKDEERGRIETEGKDKKSWSKLTRGGEREQKMKE